MRATRNNVLDQMFDVFHIVIGTSFNVEKYSFFQPNLDGLTGGKYIPFEWMCAAMGGNTAIQDLLLMLYHGACFSPILRTQWENYRRLKSQGLTIQTRIPLAGYGEKQKKKKGRVDETAKSPRVLRPSSAERRKAGKRSGQPRSIRPSDRDAGPSRAKVKARATRASRRGQAREGHQG